MENNNNNRKIIAWKPLDTETENYGTTNSNFKGQYKYVSDYCGDHSENWVVEFDKNGKETSRTNTRAIDYIQWDKE